MVGILPPKTMKFYIKDSLLNNKVVYFNTLQEVIVYLETLCVRKFKQSRKQYMIEMESLGHGYDDDTGANFTELMADHFHIGAVRADGGLVKTNLHELSRNIKYRKEMGD